MRNADFNPLFFESGGKKQASVCDLSDCNMRYANCTNAKFKMVKFNGADLCYADFTNTDLTEANFKGAKLDSAKFTGAKIDGALFDGEPPAV